MLTQVPLSETAGKTVLAAHQSSRLAGSVIVFTDGTYAALRIYEGGHSLATFIDSPMNLATAPFLSRELVEWGICTREEYNRLEVEHYRARAAEREKEERIMYERLRNKFDGREATR